MATRRRTSLEAREVNALPMKPSKVPFTQEAYDDFRRRHSRQNKEIIAENALRKTTINALQTEITNLHNELLAVRRANLYLNAKVRKAKTEHEGALSKATTDVLDQLLSAMPLLQQLRDHISSVPSESKPPIASRQFTPRSTDNPVATRPAASGAVNIVLGALAEASEDGTEMVVSVDQPVSLVHAVRRQSGVVSSNTPRLSVPGLNLQAQDQDSRTLTAFPNSPSVTSFPRSPSLVRIAGRRRESGQFIPPPKALFPPTEPSSVDDGAEPFGSAQQLPLSGVTARRGGRASSAITANKIKQVVTGLNSDSEPSPSPPPEVEIQQAAVERDTEASGKRSPVSAATSPSAPRPEILESGLRGRRVRSSVNYKEPSLTKKMRKPDGLSLEETLRRSSSRPSLDIQMQHDYVAPTGNRVVGSASTRPNDVRRKSVLPRSGVQFGRDKDEETDEEEIDSFLDLGMGGMELDEEDFASVDTRSPAPIPEPTPLPEETRRAPVPTPRKSPSRTVAAFKASSGRPGLRVSPRKKPISTSSKRIGSMSPPEVPRSHAPKSKPRDALTDMDYNPKVSAKSTSARKSTMPKDTTKVTARRRLTSLA